MNIYKVLFEHYSQKDSKVGIVTILFAENDEEVYNYVNTINYNTWNDTLKQQLDGEEPLYEIYDDDYNVIKEENIKEKYIRICGELFDEDLELNDLYYGATLYGWELSKENINIDNYKAMLELDFVEVYKGE